MKVVGGALAPLSFAFSNVTAGLIRGLAWALRMLLGSASELFQFPLVSSNGLSAFPFSYLSFLSFSSLLPPQPLLVPGEKLRVDPMGLGGGRAHGVVLE